MNKRLKKLCYRARNFGVRELETTIGSFVDANIHTLSPDELDQLDALLEKPVPEILDALAAATIHDDSLLGAALRFRLGGKT